MFQDAHKQGTAQVAGAFRYVRAAVGFILLTAALIAGLAIHANWMNITKSYIRDIKGGWEESYRKEEWSRFKEKYPAKKYGRKGETVIKIGRVRDSTADMWRATLIHRLTLQPGDPLLTEFLQEQTPSTLIRPHETVPMNLRITASHPACTPLPDFHSMAADISKKDAGPVVVNMSQSQTWRDGGLSCGTEASIRIAVQVADGWKIPAGPYERWILSIETHGQPSKSNPEVCSKAPQGHRIILIEGATLKEQSASCGTVFLPVNATKDVTILLGVPRQPTAVGWKGRAETFIARMQNATSEEREAASLLIAVITVVAFLILPFVRSWAPSSTQGRWSVTAITAGVLTGGVLASALAGIAPWPPVYEEADSGRVAVLSVWWLALLPFLLTAFVHRLTRGRPPSRVRLFSMLALPSLLLLLSIIVAAATDTELDRQEAIEAVIRVGGVALAATAIIYVCLRMKLLGVAGRRWASVASAGVWLGLLVAGPGVGLPEQEFSLDSFFMHIPLLRYDWDSPISRSMAGIALSLFWPTVAFVALTACGYRRWLSLLAVVPLWWTVDMYDLWYQSEFSQSWYSFGFYCLDVADFPLLFIQVAALAITVRLMWRDGRRQGAWPWHIRTIVIVLGVAALASRFSVLGFSKFEDSGQRTGLYIAVAIAAFGLSWLLPSTAEAEARRRHATRSNDHFRLMHSLLKDETLAAGRREFVTSSRAALAEGSINPRQWSNHWRRLRALGRQGMMPRQSVELRCAALSTSGARSAWNNGLAAAGVLAMLSLPWLVFTLPTYVGQVTLDYDQVIAVWANALRWPLYGLIYGYAYSWLRGKTPIKKALCLLIVILAAECVQLLYLDIAPGRFLIQLLLVTGNCVAMFLFLGLYWEARLVRVAGLKWGEIRDFRTLSALMVPVTSVLVAVATALGTTAVGWIDGGPGPANPSPTATSHSTHGAAELFRMLPLR
ncbi:hypothetical protein ABZZ47_19955 [Streptomyces sp. NPDC006465]|uniref:hypothetical protein n=1 Tax=Streptomyces sp. NPDC006465 TaxID=3157174 RepID=UPI0033A5E616